MRKSPIARGLLILFFAALLATPFAVRRWQEPPGAPGAARAADAVAREKLFTHSRGGRLGLEKGLPILRPDLRHK